MIKRILICISLSFFNASCVTTHPVKVEDRNFSEVINVDGYNKDQIYIASKVWLTQTFVSAKAVTEMDNKESGILMGNGVINYPCEGMTCLATSDWRVKFTMRIDMKDNKFRIGFSNVNLTWPASYSNGVAMPAHDGPVATQEDMNRIKPKLLALGDSLKNSILNSKLKNDW